MGEAHGGAEPITRPIVSFDRKCEAPAVRQRSGDSRENRTETADVGEHVGGDDEIGAAGRRGIEKRHGVADFEPWRSCEAKDRRRSAR